MIQSDFKSWQGIQAEVKRRIADRVWRPGELIRAKRSLRRNLAAPARR